MINHFALHYILRNGIDNVREITDEMIEEFLKEEEKRQEKAKENKRIPIMTIEYQKEIIEKAREICKLDYDKVVTWIKKRLKQTTY